MKNIIFLKRYLPILSVIFILAACSMGSDTEFQVYGDVIFIKKIVDDEPVVATAYYAYSNEILASCSVTPPNSETSVELEAYGTNVYTFYQEPSEEDYTTDSPNEGNYLFNVTNSKSETIEVNDEQSFYDLDFAQIDTSVFDQTNYWFYVGWEEVTGADSYIVSLLNSSGETIFTGYSVDADSPAYFITTAYTVGSWVDTPSYGETYTLRIRCYIFDSDATDDDYAYNIQEISQKDYEIVWELN